jgi:ATP-binding cassette subfamily C protein CydCD
MRPSDPRLRGVLAPALLPLAGVLVGSGFAAALVIAQAFIVAGFVVSAVSDGPVVRWAVAVVCVLAARALVGLGTDQSATRAAVTVGRNLRRRLVAALIEPGAPGAQRLPAGEAAVLATRGVSAAEPYITRYLPALVLAAVLPPLTVVAMATQDLLAAVIVLATLPLVPVFGALVGMATRDRAEEQWRAMAALSGHFMDVVTGLTTLVVFRRAEAQSDTIRTVTHRYREATARTLRIAFASSAVLELVATLSVALVAVVVGVRLAAGGLDLRTALVVLLLAPEAYWPLRRVGAEFHAAAEGAATFEAITALPSPAAPAPGGTWLGPVEIRGLEVRYAGRVVPALAALTATISPRGITALVGPSGCGKSTLLHALAGLVEPTSGTLAVGGRPVDDSWRSQVAWLPQRPTFLSGSVAENLRLARPEATDAELWKALEQVHLAERVRRMPGGLATAVGEDAGTLSAGERARLALARVVLADRPWVILDEPTAHLDADTERVIGEALTALARTSAVIVVAHRPALVRLADHVLELDLPPRSAPASAGVAPVRTETRGQVVQVGEVSTGSAGLWRGTLLGALASASGVALTATAGWLIVSASAHPPMLTLLVAIVGVRAFGLARPVLRYAERLTSHDAALRLLAERRVQVYDALVPLVPGALGRRRGDALAAIVDDAESVLDRELRVRMPVRTAVLVTVLASLVVGLLEPRAGLAIALVSLVSGGVAYVAARAGAGRAEIVVVAARADLSAQVTEVVNAADELVMWQAADAALARVEGPAASLAGATRTAGTAVALARAWQVLLAGLGVVAVGLLTSELSGPLQAFATLVPLALLEVVLPLADAGAMARRTRAAEQRLRAVENRVPLVTDPPDAHALPVCHELDVDDLAAGWDGRPVLDGLSFTLRPGERIGVVGPSGCGKSTLAAVLVRFLDPVRGEVTLGGEPLGKLSLHDVRRTVGLVDDDPHVFATTLVENIRLARPGAGDAEVEAVLRRAQLGDWLDGLPDGLHSWLGDGHAEVSGGERARLAVARALLADPDVLVLDEPTASLDSATAEAVASDVLDAIGDRAVVWITHGRAGLDRMDRTIDLTRPDGLGLRAVRPVLSGRG